MRRQPLYSRSTPKDPQDGEAARAAGPPAPNRLRPLAKRYERPLLVAGGCLGAFVAFVGLHALQPKAVVYTQADIDKAVAYSLKHRPQPSVASVAAEIIRPSVVRVTGHDPSRPGRPGSGVASAPGADPEDGSISVGSGVVMTEGGDILTNLHVVAGAPQLKVTFHDGTVSEADIVGIQAKDDLAVVRARILPDDLKPAAMASTRGLRPGDEVVAVGFPFAIGPSVSAGVVSGLQREWVFDDTRRSRNLIQFDAAANPGNSGGPLVNRRGEVLGIVTGILNPTKQGVFIGIGFAVPIENAAQAVGRNPF